jgi:hypothetical protein
MLSHYIKNMKRSPHGIILVNIGSVLFVTAPEILLFSARRRRQGVAMKKNIWRALTEVGFIIFLFYANLLMGEFTRSGMRQGKSLVWAVEDVFSEVNFAIAVIAALIGYVVVEFLRKRL